MPNTRTIDVDGKRYTVRLVKDDGSQVSIDELDGLLIAKKRGKVACKQIRNEVRNHFKSMKSSNTKSLPDTRPKPDFHTSKHAKKYDDEREPVERVEKRVIKDHVPYASHPVTQAQKDGLLAVVKGIQLSATPNKVCLFVEVPDTGFDVRDVVIVKGTGERKV